MKLFLNGKEQMHIGILGAVCGVCCDAIELDNYDAYRIAELCKTQSGLNQLADWWKNSILCRFVRPP